MARLKEAWSRRWLLIWLTIAWCGGVSTYIIVFGGADDRLRETAILAVMGLAASVILGTLGYEALDVRRLGWGRGPRARPRSEPEGEPECLDEEPEPPDKDHR